MPKSQADYDRRTEHLELLKRALAYLYTKESKSSFEIEHIKPSANRTERFVALLRDRCDKPIVCGASVEVVEATSGLVRHTLDLTDVTQSSAIFWLGPAEREILAVSRVPPRKKRGGRRVAP